MSARHIVRWLTHQNGAHSEGRPAPLGNPRAGASGQAAYSVSVRRSAPPEGTGRSRPGIMRDSSALLNRALLPPALVWCAARGCDSAQLMALTCKGRPKYSCCDPTSLLLWSAGCGLAGTFHQPVAARKASSDCLVC